MSAVSSQEYVLRDGEVIITCTDPASHITYANESFVRSSGYALEECMGRPQNLVRHPDMPKAAFADMWATIKQGEPWTGLVKNRRKDGGHYWVRANVTPIKVGDSITGFVSVRTKPSRTEIDAAARLYAEMNDGSFSGRKLQGGELIPTGVFGLFHSVWRLPLAVRCWMVLALIVACLAAPAALSFLAAPESAIAALRWGALAGIPLALALAAFLSVSVDRPIRAMTAATTEALAGNLHATYPHFGDPSLRRLSRYQAQLNEKTIGVVSDTGASIDFVRSSAHELDKGSADMSSRTEEQAANLEETAATMEQISAGLKHSSDGAQSATKVAAEASDAATRGGDAITRVSSTMDGITQTSKRIAEIISVIDGIAFQTNILALNAAVEAARAGEQGRGFAVVASEVRALAQRSANAAKEIKSLIDDSVHRVGEGAKLVVEATSTMHDIMAQVKRVSDFIGEIANGTQEQAMGVSQVNEAVAQLDQVTQSNAALVEQTAASASSLSVQADRLAESLGVLLKRD